MPTAEAPSRGDIRGLSEVRAVVDEVDQAVYDAVADTPTPRLDRLMVAASHAANYSRAWLITAAAIAIVGGASGRRAARDGVLAIALTSAVTNLVFKPLARRPRPARSDRRPLASSRAVRRPVTASFPSGHAASAFAFASAVGGSAPALGILLHMAAGTVAYSRVHTGVHYPSDVIIGAAVGEACGRAVRRRPTRGRGSGSR
jgi:undecaprenyl-diphosphatase